MARLFLGVDGGQSSTTALIGDAAGRVLGMGRGGPCNHVAAAEARARFMSAIGGCVREALENASLPANAAFESACLGFSGGPADKDALIAELFQIGRRFVTTDMIIAVSGAHAGRPGIITNAGTGSFAFARDAAGALKRVGGWGYVYGDEGSAFDIARQALRAALRMEEGWGPPTMLRALLLEAAQARSANELLHWFYTPDYTRARIATYSRLVDQAAQAGDIVAAGVLDEAAQQLAGQTLAARRMAFAPTAPARAAYIGGVFHSARLLEAFRAKLESDNLTTVGPPLYGPAAGALLEAYRIVGLKVELSAVPTEK